VFTTPILTWSEIWDAAVSFVQANASIIYPLLGITVGVFLVGVVVGLIRRVKGRK